MVFRFKKQFPTFQLGDKAVVDEEGNDTIPLLTYKRGKEWKRKSTGSGNTDTGKREDDLTSHNWNY